MLHWINAYEDGDEIVLDGFFQHNPSPTPRPGEGFEANLFRYLDLMALDARPTAGASICARASAARRS